MIDFNDFNGTISDEMLAAYIDGNVTESEKSLIENTLSSDSLLSEAVDIANDTTSFENHFDWELHEGDYGFWELGLPPILNEDSVMTTADMDNIYAVSADVGTFCFDSPNSMDEDLSLSNSSDTDDWDSEDDSNELGENQDIDDMDDLF